MNKICTSIEQSKKLVELGIDIDTADMYYWCGSDLRIGVQRARDKELDVPAWSLTALLELMPIETHLYKMQDEDNYTKHYYKVGSFDGKGWIELNNASAIDVAFETVCWLKENKKI